MQDGQISRRAFLKRFVILSMLSVGRAACAPKPVYGARVVVTVEEPTGVPTTVEMVKEPTITPTTVKTVEVPVYGVEVVRPQVDRMTYLDENMSERDLYNSKDVPISAQFIIHFTAAMHESTQDAVLLRPRDEDAIRFESVWLQGRTALKIVPDAALQYATQHTLEVGEGAKSSRGISLHATASARAEFTTEQA